MSVRDRLNQKAWEAEQAANPDVVRPTLNTGTQQSGTSRSVRQNQEVKDFIAAGPEVLGKNTSNFAGAGMVGTLGFNTSVRDRATLAASKAEEVAKPAVDTSVIDQYLAEYEARKAEAAAKEAEEIRTGKLIRL